MASQGHVLEVAYGDPGVFRQDYQTNLSNGGVFVGTEQELELRSDVVVRLRLEWSGHEIDLHGEVVHIVPAEMVQLGGRPGVAVQFHESTAELRKRLAPLCDATEPPPIAPADEERRAPRKPVRVDARIDASKGAVEGRTRNLSRSGVLVGVKAGSVPIGEAVRVALRHPTTGRQIEALGRVVRGVAGEGRVSAVAVQFDPDAANRDIVERFVDDVQGIEHTRRLGGISGPIAELGPQSIVQMFATTAPKGTILLRSGQEEGLICFESGLMILACVGGLTGLKALVRMLSWREGTFEFSTRLEECEISDAPFPLEAAVFEATRQIDEAERIDTSSFPLQARLVVRRSVDLGAGGALTKVEEALLDLAGAGFTVQRALEVIPEPDPEIFRALQSLIDEGALELH